MKHPFFTQKNLIVPVWDALQELGGACTIREIVDKIIEQHDLDDELVNAMHNERYTKLEYGCGWARTLLNKYGVLYNPESRRWAIVPEKQHVKIDADLVFKHYQKYLSDRPNHSKGAADELIWSLDDVQKNINALFLSRCVS